MIERRTNKTPFVAVASSVIRSGGLTPEELGLYAFNSHPLESYVYESEREQELIFVYALIGHPELNPDKAEVSEGKWWDLEELEQVWDRGILTPNFQTEFRRIKDRLLALL